MTTLVYRVRAEIWEEAGFLCYYKQTCTDGIGEALRAIWLCFVLFHHRQLPPRLHRPMVTILSPTPHHRLGPPSIPPESWVQHSPPGGGRHATRCYVLHFRQKFGELSFQHKLL